MKNYVFYTNRIPIIKNTYRVKNYRSKFNSILSLKSFKVRNLSSKKNLTKDKSKKQN